MMEIYLSAVPISWNHVHPVLVHFTTALFPVSLLSDTIGKYSTRYSLNEAAFWMLLYAAVATPLTAFAGWMWADALSSMSGGKVSETLQTHQLIGFALTLTYLVTAVWRGRTYVLRKKPGLTYLAAAGLITVALFYQGYLGGKLTIG